jgi:tetratricopeptide (TPR) repeat protein
LWERAARLDPRFSVVWRNLGIGYFNARRESAGARAAYDRAFRNRPADARLLYERDQLWKRLGEPPAKRLRALRRHPDLVRQRDDLCLELCALYNQTHRPGSALALLRSRRFQPWEGGEGQALGQYVRTLLALGRRALARGDATAACGHFDAALTAPGNLGEAKHLLANQSDVHYWLGCALDRIGKAVDARRHWRIAARCRGDFKEMRVRAFSEMTYYSALAWQRLGRKDKARALLRALLAHARQLRKSPARLDYFATSLPTMLLFEDDLPARQAITASFLEAQAWLGLGPAKKGRAALRGVLRRDPSHPGAADLLSQQPWGNPASA